MNTSSGAKIGCLILSIIGTALAYYTAQFASLPAGFGIALMWAAAVACALGGSIFSKLLVRMSVFVLLGGLVLYLMIPAIGLALLAMGFIVIQGVTVGRTADHVLEAARQNGGEAF